MGVRATWLLWKQCSRQRREQVQRPWGRHLLDCGRSRERGGQCGGNVVRGVVGQLIEARPQQGRRVSVLSEVRGATEGTE